MGEPGCQPRPVERHSRGGGRPRARPFARVHVVAVAAPRARVRGHRATGRERRRADTSTRRD